ncbi:hypothetical protein EAI89_19240 [Eubacterium sp. am_0171]|nr:hypothetical protein EAI89_19240 [Eubacterium sp. am_0171]
MSCAPSPVSLTAGWAASDREGSTNFICNSSGRHELYLYYQILQFSSAAPLPLERNLLYTNSKYAEEKYAHTGG